MLEFGSLAAVAALLGALTGGIALALRHGTTARRACLGAAVRSRTSGTWSVLRALVTRLIHLDDLVEVFAPVAVTGTNPKELIWQHW